MNGFQNAVPRAACASIPGETGWPFGRPPQKRVAALVRHRIDRDAGRRSKMRYAGRFVTDGESAVGTA